MSHRWAMLLGGLLFVAPSLGTAVGQAGSLPLKGAIIVVDPRRMRIRKLLIGSLDE